MRNQPLTLASILMVTFFGSQWLVGQTSYPIQGQPHGGDRRGGYYHEDAQAQAEFDDSREIRRLYQDPKTYLHNMELLAHFKGVGRGFGQAEMMTVGGNRYLFTGRMVVDVTNPKEPTIANASAPRGELAYNQALGKWILMRADDCCGVSVDIAQGRVPNPQLNPPQDVRRGVTFFDATDPRNIVEISHFSTGPGSRGTHSDGNYYDGGRYAYVTSGLPGTRGQLPYSAVSRVLQIIDVSDIYNPKEVALWWVPGQQKTEESAFLQWPEAESVVRQSWEEVWSPDWKFHYLHLHGPCLPPKRVEDGGTRAYCAYSALGMRILDVSDIQQPKEVGFVDISPPFDGGIPVHSVYPMLQRKLVIMNGETTRWDCQEGIAMPWVVDVRDEKHPLTIATFPIPRPPESAPYYDFCLRGGRLGTHHPNNYKAPGEMRIDLIGFSWFMGGWRLYDISNPFRPQEVAWIVPPTGTRRGTEGGLIEWDRRLIHVFADTGLFILSSPVLGEPVLGPLKPERWSVEGLNVGAP